MPEDEDLVHSMLKMLPPILSQEMLAKAHQESTPAALREWVRLQAEFERENPSRRAAHLVQSSAEDIEQRQQSDIEEELLELDAETLACMTAAEVNAFFKARGFKQAQRRGAQPTKRTPVSPGVRAEGERKVKCANC